MSRKIRIAGLAVVVMVIIASFLAMSVVQSKTVESVEKLSVSECSDSTASLKWKRVSSCDGYYIYQTKNGDNAFEKVATVDDKKTNKLDIKDLDQATKYDFYITAFKEKKDKTLESEVSETITACTIPRQENLTDASSFNEGELSLKWEQNNKADGYQIQYVEGDGKDFSNATSVSVKDNATLERVITKLTPKKKYAVRIRSFLRFNDEVVAGKWSKAQIVEIAEAFVNSANVDPTKPMIALTFDDGPGYNSASDDIVAILEKYNARATFFMVGRNAADHPENLKKKVALGCEIANHTYDHNHYGKNVTNEDIKKASEAIYKACGQYPTAFRSPGGNTTSTILEECKKENMVVYYWSLDTQDWKSRNADKVYNAVMNNVKDGDIILMHEIYSSTAEAVERMVPALIDKGYQLVTCEELVAAKTGKKPQVGQQYVDATSINNHTS